MGKNRRQSAKPLTLRVVLWRIWIVASLGWVFIFGVAGGSTLLVHNELSFQEARLESKMKQTVAGSYARWELSRKVAKVRRDKTDAERELLSDLIQMLGLPLAALLIGFLLSLLIPREEDEYEEPASV